MMIANSVDTLIGFFSPRWQLQRMQARRLVRSYQGAEPSRIAGNRKPKNQSADQELRGPYGADQLRAWARSLVRDNAYAWGVVDTIVSSVVGNGILPQSIVETPAGDDVESVNDIRDQLFAEWCEVCDINGQLTFAEIQALAQREIVEAGEVLIRKIRTKTKEYKGIYRPVPLALELIEADRLSQEHDTFHSGLNRDNGNRIIRGVEVDDNGKAVAYWLYKEHPNSSYTFRREQERVAAEEIIHLYRKDRIGQTRGVTWFAPVMSWLRDLGIYVDNEIQASAVASCFGVAIKTTTAPAGLSGGDADETDASGNRLDFLEPALVTYLNPNESIETINPGRPNSASEPWIALMLRGISVGTGLSYEIVARDYSKVNYSSARTSQLEDRRRFRRWQQHLVLHLCQPVWDEFCNAAAIAGADGFPTAKELLDERRKQAPVEWQTPEWEWVDPQAEQTAAQGAIGAYMSTLSDELGARGRSWRATLYQSAKERKLRLQLGLLTPEERTEQMMTAQTESNASAMSDSSPTENVAAQALNGAQVTSLVEVITQVGTGAMPKDTAKPVLQAAFPAFSPELIDSIIDPIEPGTISADGVPTAVENAPVETGSGEMMGLSTLQWNRNRKAIAKTLDELASGDISEAAAKVFLSSVGMSPASVDALVADALDGTVETELPEAEAATNG